MRIYFHGLQLVHICQKTSKVVVYAVKDCHHRFRISDASAELSPKTHVSGKDLVRDYEVSLCGSSDVQMGVPISAYKLIDVVNVKAGLDFQITGASGPVDMLTGKLGPAPSAQDAASISWLPNAGAILYPPVLPIHPKAALYTSKFTLYGGSISAGWIDPAARYDVQVDGKTKTGFSNMAIASHMIYEVKIGHATTIVSGENCIEVSDSAEITVGNLPDVESIGGNHFGMYCGFLTTQPADVKFVRVRSSVQGLVPPSIPFDPDHCFMTVVFDPNT